MTKPPETVNVNSEDSLWPIDEQIAEGALELVTSLQTYIEKCRSFIKTAENDGVRHGDPVLLAARGRLNEAQEMLEKMYATAVEKECRTIMVKCEKCLEEMKKADPSNFAQFVGRQCRQSRLRRDPSPKRREMQDNLNFSCV